MIPLKTLLATCKLDLSVDEYCHKFSPYLHNLMTTQHDWLVLHQDKDFDALFIEFQNMLDIDLMTIKQDALMAIMRLVKKRSSLVIALYDLMAEYHVSDITKMLSVVSDLLIQTAFKAASIEWIKRGKLPLDFNMLEAGSGLVVVAMGKLGAYELNFSSDIDICIFFDPQAIDDVDYHDLYDGFVRVSKSVVKLLSERTQNGYVYRVDLRLRPDPASTKIAVPIQAAEYYYECSGQNWERAAWIKGRFVHGDFQAWNKLQKLLRPFIWRRNLDFAAIQDIHSIKRQIHAHYGHDSIKVYGHDVKLGKGGIREIELFVQTQQLIGGGRDLRLRNRSTLETLGILTDKGWIKPDIAEKLNDAYCLFRKVEHRLQMVNDAQTHEIPTAGDAFDRMALFCDFQTPQLFISTMLEAMNVVTEANKTLFEHYAPLSSQKGSLVFSGVDYHPDTVKHLQDIGFEYPKTAINMISNWHKGHYKAVRSAKAREILTELTPVLLTKIVESTMPDKALLYLDRFLAGLPAGVAFFSYLIHSKKLMDLLFDIITLAPNLAEFLSHYPSTFDAMMDVSFFKPPLSEQDFIQELNYQIRPNFSQQKHLAVIRRFNREQKFRIGVLVLKNIMSPIQASKSLTILAHICIRWVAKIIEKEMRQKYKLPFEENDLHSLCIIALGSVGAYEMNVDSDLDLMMIYEDDTCFDIYNIDTKSYYIKLGKRIFLTLTEKTPEGTLYQVDMRLRPSGNAGPLVIPYARFIDYQATEAQIWEKCALTKIHTICGHHVLKNSLIKKVQQIISYPHDPQSSAHDIHQMRLKLLESRPPLNIWDVRLAQGGLFDITFIVQYLLLTADKPLKSIPLSNIRNNIINLHASHLLSDIDFECMIKTWDLYHDLLHIFAIAKLDIKAMNKISPKIKQHILNIMQIDTLDQGQNYLEQTYHQINMIYKHYILPNSRL